MAFNQTEYFKDYKKKHYKRLHFDFDIEKDKDVLDFLDSVPQKKQLICRLLREEMKQEEK